MRKISKLSIAFYIVFFAIHVQTISQERDSSQISKIQAFGMWSKGKAKIRWVPTNQEVWRLGIEMGYTIDRINVTSSDSNYKNKSRIKPWPEIDWEVFVGADDEFSLIAAQAIYGKNETDYTKEGIVAAASRAENEFGFALLACDLSSRCAHASGLYFEDDLDGFQDSTVFIYRVYIDSEIRSDTAYVPVMVGLSEESREIELDGVEGEFGLSLKWNSELSRSYSAFYVERKAEGNEFARINKLPYLEMQSDLMLNEDFITYLDSTAEIGVPYEYRIQGIDVFGSLSPYSNTIELRKQSMELPLAPSNLTHSVDGDEIVLSWGYSEDEEIEGFYIYQSDKVDIFPSIPLNSDLLSNKVKEYRIARGDSNFTKYFKVGAINSFGNEQLSIVRAVHFIDELPPSSPVGLSGSVDSTGVVSLQWTMGNEEDIFGYDVYFANSADHIFSQRSYRHLQDTVFFDSLSLKTLTEDVYYYVVALDASYNESEPSEILTLNKPDKVPPSPAVFSDYKVSEDAILIRWEESPSKDVVGQEIWRKQGRKDWQRITSLTRNVKSYLDDSVEADKIYEYKIITMDDSGLKSSSPQKLKLVSNGPFFIDRPMEVNVQKKEDHNLIQWGRNNVTCLIYKSLDEEPMLLYKVVINSNSFKDYETPNRKCKYAIKYRNEKNKESEMSDVIQVI